MQLANLDLDKLYTYADYCQWDFDERVELIKGKIFKMGPTPSPNHQILAGSIFTHLSTALNRKTHKIFIGPLDIRVFAKKTDNDDAISTVLQPDVCVICDLSKIDRRGCIGAPDIVVEVLSPGNNAKELKNKHEVYEEVGVKEYWIVSLQDQTFLVHINVGGKFQLLPVKTNGDIVTSEILPGFSLDLTDLFSEIDSENW